MLTWPQNAGNPISEKPNSENTSDRMPPDSPKGGIVGGPYDRISNPLVSAPVFCFVLLPCTSFFQNGTGTNIVGRLSKLTENYTQHHHVEL